MKLATPPEMINIAMCLSYEVGTFRIIIHSRKIGTLPGHFDLRQMTRQMTLSKIWGSHVAG